MKDEESEVVEEEYRLDTTNSDTTDDEIALRIGLFHPAAVTTV
jgi:hypothetical protein